MASRLTSTVSSFWRRTQDLQPELDCHTRDLGHVLLPKAALGNYLEERLEACGLDHGHNAAGARTNVLEGVDLMAGQTRNDAIGELSGMVGVPAFSRANSLN